MRRHRNLITDAGRERYVLRELETADHETGGEKHLVQSAGCPSAQYVQFTSNSGAIASDLPLDLICFVVAGNDEKS